MKLEGERESENVIDARGRRGAPLTLSGILLVLLVSYITGQNPLQVLSQFMAQNPQASFQPGPQSPADDETKHLLSVVLRSTEEVWHDRFRAMGRDYQEPRLVLFTDVVQSACGMSTSATGPFYCPGDQQLYIDMGFLRQLQRSLGAEGDFAAAYVVAHEVGHHVQTLLGIERQMRARQAQSGNPNAEQVKLELQADCLSGVWGFYAAKRGLLEVGDVEQGINAAKAVGDDRLQRMGGGSVSPERFTHGSSADRARWFKSGLASGDLASCDTFR